MLEAYKRGKTYWARGRVEFNGRQITGYIRESTGSSTLKGAEDWIRERTEEELRRYHFGDQKPPLTLAEGVLLADLDAQTAKYLIAVIEKIGDTAIDELSPAMIKKICADVLPNASTDTWRRWIIVPIQQVANAGHAAGRCQPVRVPSFTKQERLKQDKKRGKKSRQKKTPGSRAWLEMFRSAASFKLYVLARFMFETAARIGQAVAMTPDHLYRLDENIVVIPAAKGHDDAERVISDELAALLRSLTPTVPNGWEKCKENLRVFGYASKDGPRRAWNTACKKANIERLTPHGAGRHGFATEMFVRQGVDLKSCTEYGRWSDPSLFLQTYSHSEEATAKILAATRTNPEQ